MSLATPEKIRTLQRKLYGSSSGQSCAFALRQVEPAFRFYLLYDKICREDILRHAYKPFASAGTAPGVGRVTPGTIEAAACRSGWRACARNWSRRRTGPIRCGG